MHNLTSHQESLNQINRWTGALPVKTSTYEQRQTNLETFILSVSGFRKIFAADQDEESLTDKVAVQDLEFLLAVYAAYNELLKSSYPAEPAIIALGMDARPTGPLIAYQLNRLAVAHGCRPHYLDIVAVPEIMAYVKNSPKLQGFIYISASHNPAGHNGLKLGLENGEVLARPQALALIERLKQIYLDTTVMERLLQKCREVTPSQMLPLYEKHNAYKAAAQKKYYDFSIEIITGTPQMAAQNRIINSLKQQIELNPCGILGELNGSARATSIDQQILTAFNIANKQVNNTPGEFVHRIVPEGASLNLAQSLLQAAPPPFSLAYVPDCDGDRGNLLYKDGAQTFMIKAQELFALCTVSELLFCKYYLQKQNLALVVNGPTSNRIEHLAQKFGAQVFRAEVGEANVIALAKEKKAAGYTIRLIGEGSNGGNITLPGTVRDPLITIFALLKMLYLPVPGQNHTLAEIYLKQEGQQLNPWENRLAALLKKLPPFTTTDAFEKEARYPVTVPHKPLKAAYEKLFAQKWPQQKNELAPYDIYEYEIHNYEGAQTRIGPGNRTGLEKGGFKIQFYNQDHLPTGFLWMRGSGTEPIFRVLVDIKGPSQAEKKLRHWHKGLIEAAQAACQNQA